MNRNGNLLAQRNYTWNTHQASSLVQALVDVNVALLVISQWIPKQLFAAIDHLKSYYQLHYISPIALDPVTRPLSLTPEAQKAIRLGQRYVAPLRYWPRMHIHEFLSYLLPIEIHDFLLKHEKISLVEEMIQWESTIRWIHLRRDRNKKIRQDKDTDKEVRLTTLLTHDPIYSTIKSEVHTNIDKICWIMIMGLTPHLIQIKTLDNQISGTLDISSLAQVGLSLGDLSLYQKYPARIQSYQFGTQKLLFTFDASLLQSHGNSFKKNIHDSNISIVDKSSDTLKKSE